MKIGNTYADYDTITAARKDNVTFIHFVATYLRQVTTGRSEGMRNNWRGIPVFTCLYRGCMIGDTGKRQMCGIGVALCDDEDIVEGESPEDFTELTHLSLDMMDTVQTLHDSAINWYEGQLNERGLNKLAELVEQVTREASTGSENG